MKMLHTADWHLGDRLKHLDRTADLQRQVERIAGICEEQRVDVLLIAGDLFSDLIRPDTFQASVAHLARTFRSFLLRGGTIVALLGNHDNDVFCETLRHAFQLASPLRAGPNQLLPGGRFYLASRPVRFNLRDSKGNPVQFVCMPYPTASRYRPQTATKHTTLQQRHQWLRASYLSHLEQHRLELVSATPAVLATHLNVLDPLDTDLFRLRVQDDLVIKDRLLFSNWTYVALGHLHRSQIVSGNRHVRYSGSIDRLDMGERDHQKGVLLIDLQGDWGEACNPPATRFFSLPATPFYDVKIQNPTEQIPLLRTCYPDAQNALVRCHVSYRPGKDDLCEILAELARVFPRCYERTWNALSNASPPTTSQLTSSHSTKSSAGVNLLNRESLDPHGVDHDESQHDSVTNAECRTDSNSLLAKFPELPNLQSIDINDMESSIMGYLQSQLADDPDLHDIVSLAEQLLGGPL